MENEIRKFIDRFTDYGRRGEVVDCFAGDCGWWFATILAKRFRGGYILCDETGRRFACQIGERAYDITGDVTGQRHWAHWREYCRQRPGEWAEILTDQIFF